MKKYNLTLLIALSFIANAGYGMDGNGLEGLYGLYPDRLQATVPTPPPVVPPLNSEGAAPYPGVLVPTPETAFLGETGGEAPVVDEAPAGPRAVSPMEGTGEAVPPVTPAKAPPKKQLFKGFGVSRWNQTQTTRVLLRLIQIADCKQLFKGFGVSRWDQSQTTRVLLNLLQRLDFKAKIKIAHKAQIAIYERAHDADENCNDDDVAPPATTIIAPKKAAKRRREDEPPRHVSFRDTRTARLPDGTETIEDASTPPPPPVPTAPEVENPCEDDEDTDSEDYYS